MQNRRNFILQASVLSIGLMACPASLLSKREVGIQLWTVRDLLTNGQVPMVIKSIAAAGYKQVEVFGYDKDKFFGLSVSEFAKILKDNNLSVPSGHYNIENFLFKNGNGDDVKKTCEVVKQLGGSYLTIPWFSEEKRTNIDQYKALAERINKAGEICKANNIQLTYHNHDFEFKDFNGQTGYDMLLKNTDSNLLKMEMDIYWVVFAGKDPIKLFKENSGRFHLWHVKDMSKADRTKNTEIGNGSIDYVSLVAASKDAGVKHFFVEQENNYAPDIYGSIKTSSDNVKQYLAAR